MKHNDVTINNELETLKAHMEKNQLGPSESIVADNELHIYTVEINGELHQASYTVILYPFDDDSNGPVLISCYGLIDSLEQYTYSSLIKESF